MNYILNYIGLLAPVILLLLTIVFLFDKQTYMLFFIGGFILNNLFNILLKSIIKDPRPNNDKLLIEILTANGKRLDFDKYGMPSGHAQMCGFALSYITLTLNNPYVTGLYLLITIISLIQRYKNNNHTLLQLIIGLLLGLIIGYLFYHITNKYIKGNLLPKKDDKAPK
jgi:dolichyldiphosphatase